MVGPLLALVVGLAQTPAPASVASKPAQAVPVQAAKTTGPVAVHQAAKATGPLALQKAAQIDGALGKLVVVEGVAQNAKIAALVEAGDFMVYVVAKHAWRDAEVGKRVRVVGELHRSDAWKAYTTADGAVTQGTAGSILLLRDAIATVIE